MEEEEEGATLVFIREPMSSAGKQEAPLTPLQGERKE